MTSILGIILLIFVIVTFALAIVRPHVCFALVIAFPVLEQAIQSYFAFFDNNRSAFNFMVVGIALLAVMVRFFRDPLASRNVIHPILTLILLVQFMGYASLLWTPDLGNGLDLTYGQYPYTLLYVVIAPLLLTSIDDFRRVSVPMLVIGTVSLLLIVLGPAVQFYGARMVVNLGGKRMLNTLIVGQVGGTVMVFAALSNFRGFGKWALPIQLGAGVFGLGMGILSGTRGQVMVSALLSFLFFPLSRKAKGASGFFGLTAGIAIILGLIYMAVSFFLVEKTLDRWSMDSLSGGFAGRWNIIQEALGPWLVSPFSWVFGRGAGSFLTTNSVHVYPHNYPVEVLTELGLIGAFLYVLMLVYVVRACFGLHRIVQSDLQMRSAAAVLMALVTMVMVLSLKQGTIHGPGLFYVWPVVLGRIFAFESSEEAQVYRDDELDEFDDEEEYAELSPDDDESVDPQSGYSHA